MTKIWALIAWLAVTDAVWLAFSPLKLDPASLAIPSGACALLLALALFYRSWRRDPRLAALAETSAAMLAYTAAAAILSYLIVALRLPLVDDRLAAFDRALGFDWPAMHGWIMRHKTVKLGLTLCYYSLIPQIIALMLILHGRGDLNRARELLALFIGTSLGCVALSALLPTAGAFIHFHADTPDPYVHAFLALRDGSMGAIDLGHMQGVVQFPSFHLALAVICAWAARGIKILFPLLLILNVAVILATPAIGGHHLADLCGGALLTLVVLGAVRVKNVGLPPLLQLPRH